jgi:hypothetical protein
VSKAKNSSTVSVMVMHIGAVGGSNWVYRQGVTSGDVSAYTVVTETIVTVLKFEHRKKPK